MPPAREALQKFRTPGEGEPMTLIERMLPNSVARPLSEEEMVAYRAPLRRRKAVVPCWPCRGTSRSRGTLRMCIRRCNPRSIATYPRLLFVGEPGALITPAYAANLAARLQHVAVVPLARRQPA